MTLEEFQTYLKRPATMEEAGEIVDILGSTILSAVKMLPNTDHSLRAKYFSRRTRRREKWIGLDSRPASRELCEAHNGPRRAA